jgi:hypothetical protein
MRNTGLLLIALMCLAAVPSQTEDSQAEDTWQNESKSGNAFVRQCSSVDRPTGERAESDLLKVVECASYVHGLAEGIQFEFEFLEQKYMKGKDKLPAPYCTGDRTVAVNQRVRILLKYVRDNPGDADLPTAGLYLLAMKQAFPCPANK